MAKTRRARRPSLTPRLQLLEPRTLLSSVFTVTDPGDTTTGQTLRAAILAADAPGGPTTIDFNLPGTAPFTIQPATPLPTVTSSVTMDGTSQPGYTHAPLIFIDGTHLGQLGVGLAIRASGVVVRGLAIGNCAWYGISIDQSHQTQIASCYIGVDTTGTHAAPNGTANLFPTGGIDISSSLQTTIGGATSGDGNLISGNWDDGIGTDTGTSGNLIENNDIGTDASGESALGNLNGISDSGSGSVIRGNVVSGNSGAGILSGDATTIEGNFVGTDLTGVHALGNGGVGVLIFGANSSVIGNTISNNKGTAGLTIHEASGTLVQGNLIGNISGISGNTGHGIWLEGARKTTIGGTTSGSRNIISGNGQSGIDVSASTVNHVTTNATQNLIEGNWIGLNASGKGGQGNGGSGIDIQGASGTTIGGTVAGAGNVIGSSSYDGITVAGASATGTVIAGNIVGLAANGQDPAANGVPKGNSGITLHGTIGTLVAKNVISENAHGGVYVIGGYGSVIQGNYIGTDATGMLARGNIGDGIDLASASLTIIGGTTYTAANIISDNSNSGVYMYLDPQNPQVKSINNIIEGNLIGLNALAKAGYGNGGDGISIHGPAGTTIGGTVAGAGNIIDSSVYNGINIQGPTTTGTVVEGNLIGLAGNGTDPGPNGTTYANSGVALGATIGVVIAHNVISESGNGGIYILGGYGSVIQGNLIGTDSSGTVARGNIGDGIVIDSAALTQVGGSTPGTRNVIAANTDSGIRLTNQSGGGTTGSVIQGNFLGLDGSGLKAMPNDTGIYVDHVPGTTIGGPGAAGNVISGNSQYGVYVYGAPSTGTQVLGNVIGLGFDASTLVPNPTGIVVNSAPGAQITGNIVSANRIDGVYVYGTNTAGTVISQNLIGLDGSGTQARGNGADGVHIDNGAGVVVGGVGVNSRNTISGNGTGVQVDGASSTGDKLEGNWIGLDVTGLKAVGNKSDGVLLRSPGVLLGGTTAAARNIISGNAMDGVHLMAGATGDTMAGNWIGLDATGLHAVGNKSVGVCIDNAAGNHVGGAFASWANYISGNGVAEVEIVNAGSTSNTVQGNFIGTDATQAGIASPAGYGILIFSAGANLIGGAAPYTANLIVGHAIAGIDIVNPGSFFNLVIGNLIGPGRGAAATRANGIGVLINNAPSNTIGGTAAGYANTIQGNVTNTIVIAGASATGNQTTGNIIG